MEGLRADGIVSQADTVVLSAGMHMMRGIDDILRGLDGVVRSDRYSNAMCWPFDLGILRSRYCVDLR